MHLTMFFNHFTCLAFAVDSLLPVKPTGRAIDSNDLVSGQLFTFFLLIHSDTVSPLQSIADGIVHLFITVYPYASGNTDKMFCVM